MCCGAPLRVGTNVARHCTPAQCNTWRISQSLRIGFSDLSAVILPVKNHPELAQLSRTQLDGLVLGFAGSAICLAEQDLHISIAGLVSASVPLMAMAATVVATRNGSRSSASKAVAARENGQKGGRPRKLLAAG